MFKQGSGSKHGTVLASAGVRFSGRMGMRVGTRVLIVVVGEREMIP